MQILEEIEARVAALHPHQQEQVLNFVLFLHEKQKVKCQENAMTDELALTIHDRLLDQYADTFEKLAQ